MKIRNESQLREIYKYPKGRAKDKVLIRLEKHSVNFIKSSPFVVVSTVDNAGKMDASPRGGEPGFVKISGEQELIIPDYKGNNRVDTLTNIVQTGRIGLLFLIPGIDETLRVNGNAKISTSEEYLNHFSNESKAPISCIIISTEEIFLHCAKAFMRSKLWNSDFQLNPSEFPSIGQMLTDQLKTEEEVESREAMIQRYLKDI